jgi:hypothetical protein
MAQVSDIYARNVLATYHKAMIAMPGSMYPYKDSMQRLIDYWNSRHASWWNDFRTALKSGELSINEHNEVMKTVAAKHAGFVPASPMDFFESLAAKTQDWTISKLFKVVGEESSAVVTSAVDTGKTMFANLGVVLKYAPYAALAVGAAILFYRFKGSAKKALI